MNRIPSELWLEISSYCVYTDLIFLGCTCIALQELFRYNFLPQLDEKSAIIKSVLAKHVQGKQTRYILQRQYYPELYNFKPFTISIMLDGLKRSNRKYVADVFSTLRIYQNRDTIDPIDLTKNQIELFLTVLAQDRVCRTDIKKVLRTLTINQLKYVRNIK